MHNYAPGSIMDTVTQMNRRLAEQQAQMRRSTQETLRIIEQKRQPVAANFTPPPMPQARTPRTAKKRSLLARLLKLKG